MPVPNGCRAVAEPKLIRPRTTRCNPPAGGPVRTLLVVLSGLLTVSSATAYLLAWLRHMGGNGTRESED